MTNIFTPEQLDQINIAISNIRQMEKLLPYAISTHKAMKLYVTRVHGTIAHDVKSHEQPTDEVVLNRLAEDFFNTVIQSRISKYQKVVFLLSYSGVGVNLEVDRWIDLVEKGKSIDMSHFYKLETT